MKITFTELEESEQRQFEEALGAHELSFVPSLADVLPDTKVLSVFISSRRQASHLIIDHLPGEETSAAMKRSQEIEKLMLIDRLLARPNVVFTPHIAFNCAESIECINASTQQRSRTPRAFSAEYRTGDHRKGSTANRA